MRVILDANLWISYFISPVSAAGAGVSRLLIDARVTVLSSPGLEAEVVDVLQRPRIIKRLPSGSGALAAFQAALASLEQIRFTRQATVCRDPKDNYLLDIARDGHADLLLTGDQALLSVKTFGSTRILPINSLAVWLLLQHPHSAGPEFRSDDPSH